MVKTYVLDTNILMSTEGRAIYGFEDNSVIITHTTQEELDKLKEGYKDKERGHQARAAIRQINAIIDSMNEEDDINTGIYLKARKADGTFEKDENGRYIPRDVGGTFRIVTNFIQPENLPVGYSLESPDNRILCTTKTLSKTIPNVILITNDISLKTKAQAIGLEVQTYLNDEVEGASYTGRRVINVLHSITAKFYKDGEVSIDYLAKKAKTANSPLFYVTKEDIEGICQNEFVIFKDETNVSCMTWRKGDKLVLFKEPQPVYGVKPLNVAQKLALEALKAPVEEVPFVILKGPAGCGKTLLALAVGLSNSYDEKKSRIYDSVVITRSNTQADEELGFLPGDLEDKMDPLLGPFWDNLKYIFGNNSNENEKEKGKKGKAVEEDRQLVLEQIDYILETKVLEILALSYIRGRSFRNTFLIVDESQNLTRTQAKTIVTRMGKGSKLILLGDPEQIDTAKLTKTNNGLVYLSEAFKNSPLCAEVTFNKDECERSPLAEEALRVLS